MDQKEQLLEQYRHQLEELNQKIDALSQDDPKPQRKESIPVYYAPQFTGSAPKAKPNRKREGVLGRNLFAILATVLILAGVCIFISSIYAYISEAAKMIIIYGFGGALLLGGLALYHRKENRFWLGVTGCGLAELLVCVFASYGYFDVLPLSVTFVLCLIWVLTSLWLTRFQPRTFKTIGYIGFSMALWLGLGQVGSHDNLLLGCLLASFTVLSLYFMVTTPQCTKINGILALFNVLQLPGFFRIYDFMPESIHWMVPVLVSVILIMYHGVYVLRNFHRNIHPYAAVASCLILSFFYGDLTPALALPLELTALLGLWMLCVRLECKTCHRIVLSVYAILQVLSLSTVDESLWIWFALVTAIAYGLYYLTRKRDVAWIGLVSFGVLYSHLLALFGAGADVLLVVALGFFLLTGGKYLRRDFTLQAVWYAVMLLMADSILESLTQQLVVDHAAAVLINSLYVLLLTAVNTCYLHHLLSRRKDWELTPGHLLVMLIHLAFYTASVERLSSQLWFEAMLHVIISLLAISYSPFYLWRTGQLSGGKLLWQFIKYTLYIGTVISGLNVSPIIGNILVLIIGAAAIVTGIRLDLRHVRTYGLVLSLVDVCNLVLFQIEYTDSLQFSLGIIACGALCFVISYLYSRFAKSGEEE